MTALLSNRSLITEENYLAGEPLSEIRHEYIAGVVHAMAGASVQHNTITHNIGGLLFMHLRGKACQAFGSDMKLRLEFGAGTVYYYPDAMVCCDPTDKARNHKERPVLIVEVLSPETSRVDQREKLLAYCTLPSLEMYVLVDQEECRVIVHRRDGDWRAEFLTDPAASLTVPGLGWSVSLREIYERTGLAD